MKIGKNIHKACCLLALVLTFSIGFIQTSLASQKTKESANSPKTEAHDGYAASVAQVDSKTDRVHVETGQELCCQVITVPIQGPSPTMRLMQSNGPFSVLATFDANITAAQRTVIQQAVGEWERIILTRGFTPAGYPITFSNGPLAGGTLARATVSHYVPSGDLISTEIVFDDDGSTTWFVDTTPANDSEFSPTPPAGTDLLSVARHEIGHAVGFIDTPRVTGLLSGNTFDPSRLNIAAVDSGGHSDPDLHVNDLMVPTIGASTRRAISLYPDSALIARAYHYDITMRFVDAGYWLTGGGSANDPWSSFTRAVSLTPAGQHLLVVPGTYQEPMPLVLSVPMTVSAARGRKATIGSP